MFIVYTKMKKKAFNLAPLTSHASKVPIEVKDLVLFRPKLYFPTSRATLEAY